jgi:DNA-binding IclR family transcriptional regulator
VKTVGRQGPHDTIVRMDSSARRTALEADAPPRPDAAGTLRPAAAAAAVPAKAKVQKGIASVETAARVLAALEAAGGPVALKDLAKAIGCGTGAAHHYLVSLVRTGLARQNPVSGLYDLGPFALQVGLSALARIDVVDRASEALLRLRELAGESCFLAVWGSFGPTIVRYVQGLRILPVEMRAGFVLPLLGSATGHVFLAFAPDATLAPVLQRELGPRPSRASRDAVAATQRQVRQDGIGQTSGGVLPRVAGMAAPVFEYGDRLAGVISTMGWADEFDMTLDGRVAAALRTVAGELTRELGGTAQLPGGSRPHP